MPERIATEPYRIALLGFSPFERGAMASYFRLAMHRQPRYVPADGLDEAQFLVADSESAGVVDTVARAGRSADTVFVGAQRPPGAAASMSRPIDPLQVLRALDELVARSGQEAVTIVLPLPRAEAAPAARAAAGARTRPGGTEPGAPAADAALPVALLVDEDGHTLQALERALRAWPVQLCHAPDSHGARAWLSRRPFGLVFIDAELGEASEMDGLSLCRYLKQQPARAGRPVPRVVILSVHHRPVDQVRGALAGCDAYLAKPLDLGALRRTMAGFGWPCAVVEPAAGRAS